MNRPSVVCLVFAVGVVGLVAACGSDQPSAAPRTSDQPTSSEASTRATPRVVDADPADYTVATDRYRFKLDGSPLRECAIYPSPGTTVACSVTWPDGTPAAPVQGSPFDGPPNTIVLSQDGYYPIVEEGGPPGAALLPVNSRLSVNGVSCTAVSGGVQCANASGGFSFVDGVLETEGPTSLPPVVEPWSAEDPAPLAPGGTDGVYTEGTTPVLPGTACGAATGRQPVVEVRSGSISCTDALAVMDRYNALPRTGEFGNANIRQFDGWTCASPTAASAAENGYDQTCSLGDIEIGVPHASR